MDQPSLKIEENWRKVISVLFPILIPQRHISNYLCQRQIIITERDENRVRSREVGSQYVTRDIRHVSYEKQCFFILVQRLIRRCRTVLVKATYKIELPPFSLLLFHILHLRIQIITDRFCILLFDTPTKGIMLVSVFFPTQICSPLKTTMCVGWITVWNSSPLALCTVMMVKWRSYSISSVNYNHVRHIRLLVEQTTSVRLREIKSALLLFWSRCICRDWRDRSLQLPYSFDSNPHCSKLLVVLYDNSIGLWF